LCTEEEGRGKVKEQKKIFVKEQKKIFEVLLANTGFLHMFIQTTKTGAKELGKGQRQG
jgi:hypothetical protein